MYRNVITELVSWYEEKRRRILFIKGAHGEGGERYVCVL